MQFSKKEIKIYCLLEPHIIVTRKNKIMLLNNLIN